MQIETLLGLTTALYVHLLQTQSHNLLIIDL